MPRRARDWRHVYGRAENSHRVTAWYATQCNGREGLGASSPTTEVHVRWFFMTLARYFQRSVPPVTAPEA